MITRDSKSNNKRAFTLAEVLITLLIIGIISSIVIPTLLNDTQNAELKVAWKKAYSELSQASMRLYQENGPLNYSQNSEELINQFLPYLNYSKSCDGSNWGGNCWHKPGTIKYFNGTPFTSATMTAEFDDNPAIILSNGALVLFVSWDCNTQGFCGHISVDINGFKKPNVVGKDILRLWILKNGSIQPEGSPKSRYPGECPGSSGEGWGCSANYLYN